VIGDLSQQQMVLKKREKETPKERRKRQIRNRLVYNDWGLSRFVQMLAYKCLHAGKELFVINERDTTKMCHVCQHTKDMPLWQRVYRCRNCGLVMDRDENSAVNIFQRFLARLGPHTDDSVRCAAVFTAIENQCAEVFTATDNVLNICEHI
ncbi:MAG TPA: transposase, partial [Ktedonobacteraceae bacterium]|nr:transposase [Ktedonobacteraceae bacterium]